MCSSPKIPKPTPPPQEVKQPDSTAARSRQRDRARMAGGNGTLLTGPSGLGAGALNTGGTSLLGG